MTDEEFAELAELTARATPASWSWSAGVGVCYLHNHTSGHIGKLYDKPYLDRPAAANAALVVALRNAIGPLIERDLALRGELRAAIAVRDDARAASQRALDQLRDVRVARDAACILNDKLLAELKEIIRESGRPFNVDEITWAGAMRDHKEGLSSLQNLIETWRKAGQ